jgi:hypothetical protein
MTSTMWRFAEQAYADRPIVALVTGHPHPAKRKLDFNAAHPCRYCVQSPAFVQRFGTTTEVELFNVVVGYCGAQRAGPLGQGEIVLADNNGGTHVFRFETFFNGHEALSLGVWMHPRNRLASIGQ